MKTTLMISVAAASLFALTTLAAAQGANRSAIKSDDAPAAASPRMDEVAPANPGKMAPETKTTGNAATSATAGPSAEKRTEIFSEIKHEKADEVPNATFNMSVGATIPRTVSYHALPPRIVAIYPEWRGYHYVLVRGEYIIVRPGNREIVYIIQG